MPKKIIEHDHRLKLVDYTGQVRASFTLCIKNRIPVFVNANIVNPFIDMLAAARKQHHCANWAYVFMPDHVHIVLEGTSENASLWKTIVLFKQKSGYWFLKYLPNVSWQKDFYDHIHRTKDELLNHILYVANNPVRKNLVDHWRKYPFVGSLDNELEAIIWD
jgi:putative transposase